MPVASRSASGSCQPVAAEMSPAPSSRSRPARRAKRDEGVSCASTCAGMRSSRGAGRARRERARAADDDGSRLCRVCTPRMTAPMASSPTPRVLGPASSPASSSSARLGSTAVTAHRDAHAFLSFLSLLTLRIFCARPLGNGGEQTTTMAGPDDSPPLRPPPPAPPPRPLSAPAGAAAASRPSHGRWRCSRPIARPPRGSLGCATARSSRPAACVARRWPRRASLTARSSCRSPRRPRGGTTGRRPGDARVVTPRATEAPWWIASRPCCAATAKIACFVADVGVHMVLPPAVMDAKLQRVGDDVAVALASCLQLPRHGRARRRPRRLRGAPRGGAAACARARAAAQPPAPAARAYDRRWQAAPILYRALDGRGGGGVLRRRVHRGRRRPAARLGTSRCCRPSCSWRTTSWTTRRSGAAPPWWSSTRPRLRSTTASS